MRKAEQFIFRVTRLLFLLLLLTVSLQEAKGCTSFILKGGGRQYLAKNLDWHCGHGYIIYNPDSVVRRSVATGPFNLEWVSRYSSITFNQFGIGFPLGGMNSAGLVIEELNAPVQGTPPVRSLFLNEFQWIQYQLDNHSDISEVLNSLPITGIKPIIQNLHYILMDRHGEVAIIEIINGEFKVYSGEDVRYPVLSNNLYGNSLEYLKNFSGFGGEIPVIEHTDSQSRFVTISEKLKYHKPETVNETFAFQLLEKVSQEDTQWSIVYDNVNSVIFYRTAVKGDVLTISFLFSNSMQGRHTTFSDLTFSTGEIDLRAILTPEINSLLYDKIEGDYRQAGTSKQKMSLIKDLFVSSTRIWPTRIGRSSEYDGSFPARH